MSDAYLDPSSVSDRGPTEERGTISEFGVEMSWRLHNGCLTAMNEWERSELTIEGLNMDECTKDKVDFKGKALVPVKKSGAEEQQGPRSDPCIAKIASFEEKARIF